MFMRESLTYVTSLNVGLYPDIYKPISFKPGTTIETILLSSTILILVWMTFTFLQGRSGNLTFELDEFSATACWFV